jgi:L-lactate dehydrogenase
MQIAVIGTGNVGRSLLHSLATIASLEKILVMSRSESTAVAAIMDIASAFPKSAEKMHYALPEKLSDADIIVSTAGIQPLLGQSAKDVFVQNIDISENMLKAENIKDSAIIICVATPVDDITSYIQRKSKLPFNQVLGFGGDLDKNRLEYILRRRYLDISKAHIVGEHGRNVIPVYHHEADYSEIATEMRGFSTKISALAGHSNHLCTGSSLAKLVNSIVTDSKSTHYICGYHKEYGVYLTWPYVIGRAGILKPENVHLGAQANRDIETLISSRRNFFDQKRFAQTVTIKKLEINL